MLSLPILDQYDEQLKEVICRSERTGIHERKLGSGSSRLEKPPTLPCEVGMGYYGWDRLACLG